MDKGVDEARIVSSTGRGPLIDESIQDDFKRRVMVKMMAPEAALLIQGNHLVMPGQCKPDAHFAADIPQRSLSSRHPIPSQMRRWKKHGSAAFARSGHATRAADNGEAG